MSIQTAFNTSLQVNQKLEQNLWNGRKDPAEDVFARVFADTKDLKKDQDKIAPREAAPPSEPREPAARPACKHADKPASRTRETREEEQASANQDTEESAEAPQETTEQHACEKPKPCAKGDKQEKTEDNGKEMAKDDSQNPNPSLPQAEATETVDPSQLLEMVDVPTDTTADDKPVVAFCLSPALQAQAEASETCGTGEKEDGAEKPAQQSGEDSLQNLLSFRPDIKTGVATAGKQPGNEAPVLPKLKEDVQAALTLTPKPAVEQPETMLPHETAEKPKTDVPVALLTETPAEPQDEKFDFTALMQNLPKPKKEEVKDKITTDASLKVDAKSNADSGQPSSPAAGSRVNALTGFPAPTPTGSGGGSPPPLVKGVEIQQATGVGVAQANNDVTNSATVQLTHAARPMAHLPPSEQVGITVARMAKAGINQFDLQLHPADLGKVNIRLEINQDGFVRATVTADNPAAYAVLQKDSGALEKVLQQAGLQTDSSSLSFNLQQGETQRQQQEANQNNPAWKRWNENAGLVDQGEQIQTSYYVATPGRVDVTI